MQVAKRARPEKIGWLLSIACWGLLFNWQNKIKTTCSGAVQRSTETERSVANLLFEMVSAIRGRLSAAGGQIAI